MAIGGTRPKPVALKLATGNPGKRPLPGNSSEVEVRTGDLVPDRVLSEAEQVLWDRFINTAWWLTEPDISKAAMWASLQAEFNEDPREMTAARIGQLRALGSELGFDPSSRARMPGSQKTEDPAEKYFG